MYMYMQFKLNNVGGVMTTVLRSTYSCQFIATLHSSPQTNSCRREVCLVFPYKYKSHKNQLQALEHNIKFTFFIISFSPYHQLQSQSPEDQSLDHIISNQKFGINHQGGRGVTIHGVCVWGGGGGGGGGMQGA